MNSIVKIIYGVLILVVMSLAIYTSGYIVYFWFLGVLTGMGYFGVPYWLGILLILVGYVYTTGIATVVCFGFGVWAGVTLLAWSLPLVIMLYAPTFALYALFLSFGGLVVAVSGAITVFREILSSR